MLYMIGVVIYTVIGRMAHEMSENKQIFVLIFGAMMFYLISRKSERRVFASVDVFFDQSKLLTILLVLVISWPLWFNVAIVLMTYGSGDVSLSSMFRFIASALYPGMGEEVVARLSVMVMVLHKVARYQCSKWWLFALGSVPFGMCHFINLGHEQFNVVIQQVVYATVLGMVFMVIYLMTQTIWMVAIMHTLIDLRLDEAKLEVVHWLDVALVFVPIVVVSVMIMQRLEFGVKNNPSI
ncbi:CPBP family intramembrane metalloprotease [Weissella confusa]|uniref:CPBP family intramembrane metalloprotease n=1 Tax=Weissella confusa TaxID=1583 RepID=A0AAJ2YWQ4_WEICO|nr:CPBP family intramembrane glutamic endopeptidase [Weissella confusa]MBJ7693722.1 CPBP family intramembrane metalloprotease [Weissella confusa]NBA10698.1 CPBP family intramembrane metalloprotease [Weissella confusa]